MYTNSSEGMFYEKNIKPQALFSFVYMNVATEQRAYRAASLRLLHSKNQHYRKKYFDFKLVIDADFPYTKYTDTKTYAVCKHTEMTSTEYNTVFSAKRFCWCYYMIKVQFKQLVKVVSTERIKIRLITISCNVIKYKFLSVKAQSIAPISSFYPTALLHFFSSSFWGSNSIFTA